MYEIIVTKITREQEKNRKWKQVGKKDEDNKPVYDYVDEIETKDVEREIYRQKVDELDLKKVINAVNGNENA